jgi:5'-methylthioadenosine phosphorylase
MNMVRLAVIGGSGLYDMPQLSDVEEYMPATPFGPPSDAIRVGVLEGVPVAFLARHGRGHRHIPSEVPYRANIYALKLLGVERVISISACGSLREQLHPGEVVVPDQLYDQTRGRANTFFGSEFAAHVSVADPFCPQLSADLADVVEQVGGRVHRGGTVITIEGPRFSTRAESHVFRQWGMDVINMTTSPEAFLAREAEMCYAVMNHISDYDVWHDTREPVTVDMVLDILHQNATLAQEVIRVLVSRMGSVAARRCHCGNALQAALITARDRIPAAALAALRPLVGRYLG